MTGEAKTRYDDRLVRARTPGKYLEHGLIAMPRSAGSMRQAQKPMAEQPAQPPAVQSRRGREQTPDESLALHLAIMPPVGQVRQAACQY
jgi:hypothetical protein